MDNFKITKKIRLVGVGTSGFSSITASLQMALFENNAEAKDEWEKVDRTLDSISKKFGKDVIGRATLKE
jgi:DNA polymerase-4